MKIGIKSWVWVAPFSSDKHLGLISKVGSLGAQTFEFAIEDESVMDAAAVRRTLEDEGLGCSIVGTFGPAYDLSSDDPAVRRLGIDHARRCLDTSATVGASLFTAAAVGAGKYRHNAGSHNVTNQLIGRRDHKLAEADDAD